MAVCERPFEKIARELDCSEENVLQQVKLLKASGIIRRIAAVINYRALGRVGTLAMAHIADEDVKTVAEAVNSLENVSHNYLRKHYYNLWFTLQGETYNQTEEILKQLSEQFGSEFHSLPAKRSFKLDVRFDTENQSQQPLQPPTGKNMDDKTTIVQLDDGEKYVISKLQAGFEPVARPYEFICNGSDMSIEQCLGIIKQLTAKNVVRRIAAIVNHRKIGFTANVMFAGKIDDKRIVEAGRKLSSFDMVTHCYERKTLPGWPYNLYAMMHGRSMNEIQLTVDKFVEAGQVDTYQLLPTVQELKKQPVKYRFQ